MYFMRPTELLRPMAPPRMVVSLRPLDTICDYWCLFRASCDAVVACEPRKSAFPTDSWGAFRRRSGWAVFERSWASRTGLYSRPCLCKRHINTNYRDRNHSLLLDICGYPWRRRGAHSFGAVVFSCVPHFSISPWCPPCFRVRFGFTGEVCWRAEAALRLGAGQRVPSTLRRPWIVRCAVRAHHSAASHVQGNSVSRGRLLIML